jgi:hypothetical protein
VVKKILYEEIFKIQASVGKEWSYILQKKKVQSEK